MYILLYLEKNSIIFMESDTLGMTVIEESDDLNGKTIELSND